MDVGTGIFLSALFLGTVGLYIATKDRWNWKKIFVWPLGIIVVLWALGFGGNFVYEQYRDRYVPPEKPMSLWDIALQATPADVKFAKGEPSSKLEDETWLYLLSPGNQEGGAYVVRFKDGKARFVIYDGPQHLAPTVAGVSAFSTLAEIETLLGKASSVSHSKDDLKRIYSFDRFNVVVGMAKNQVYGLGIFDASTGPLMYKEK